MPNRKNGRTLTCEECGTEFYAPKALLGKRRFCSNACKLANWTRGTETRVCEICGKEFRCSQSRAMNGGRYCSKACHRRAQRNSVTRICQVCGAEFTVWASRSDALYCTKACQGKAQSLRVERTCEQCGRTFLAQRDRVLRGIARYCSKRCYGDALMRRIPVTCAHCGKPFETKPHALATGRGRYCSRDCYYDAAGIEESGTEQALRLALGETEIPFKQEVPAGRYRIDFLVGRLAVEVDSEFWHSLPGAAERDQRKDAYLTAHGYHVLRIPEEAVRSNIAAVLTAIKGGLNRGASQAQAQ